MTYITVEETNSEIAQLVDQVSKGEEIIFVRDHAAIAKIVPIPNEAPAPREGGYGSAKHKILYMADDFDAPLEDFKDYT